MHTHVSEPWLLHAFAWAVMAAFGVAGVIVIVEVFGPRLGALLVGLGA
jgi:hypothetical protein